VQALCQAGYSNNREQYAENATAIVSPPVLCFAGGEMASRLVGQARVACRALQRLAVGLVHLIGAAIAWQQMAPLVTAAAPHASNGADTPPLIETHDVVFRYRDRGVPVLVIAHL
jgi:hypothetical protein